MKPLKPFFYIIIILFCAGSAGAQYNFQLICRTDTQQMVQPYGLGYYPFTLTNTGTVPDQYELNCAVVQIPPGWAIIYCLKGRCLEPGAPMYDTLGPGESDTTIEIKVYPTATPGQTIAVLIVRSLGDTSNVKSVTTITTLSGAIEENTPSLLLPLKNSNPKLLSLFSSEPGILIDPSGKKLFYLPEEQHRLFGLRAGIYFLKRPGQVLKLILF